ncbi:MAG: FecR domain-containing protein, partial [Planctomycetota bacterium]
MSADAELLLLFADGECSEGEGARAAELLRADPNARRHCAALIRQRLMLAELESAESVAAEGREPLLVIAEHPETPAEARRPRRWGWAAAAAAVLLLAAGVAAGWLARGASEAGYVVSGSAKDLGGQRLTYGSLLEPEGADSVEAMLEDHSVISVTPQSRVRLAARRELDLEGGELRVACSKDPERKFVVRAGDSTVTALGTEFVVRYGAPSAPSDYIPRMRGQQEEARQMGKTVRVMVLSGAVILANGLGQVRLTAGERGEGHEGGKPDKVKGEGKGPKEGKGEGRGRGHGLNDDDLEKLGDFVQAKLAEGLRGKELAEAIHAWIAARKAEKDARKGERERGRGKGPKDGEGPGHGKGPKDGEGRGHGKGPRDGEGRGHGKGPKDGEGEGKHRHKHKEGEGDGEGRGRGRGRGDRDDDDDDVEDDEDEGEDEEHEGRGRGRGRGDRGDRGRGRGRGAGEGRGRGRGDRDDEGDRGDGPPDADDDEEGEDDDDEEDAEDEDDEGEDD